MNTQHSSSNNNNSRMKMQAQDWYRLPEHMRKRSPDGEGVMALHTVGGRETFVPVHII